MCLGKVNPAIQALVFCCHYSRRAGKTSKFSSVKMPLSDLQSGDEKQAGWYELKEAFQKMALSLAGCIKRMENGGFRQQDKDILDYKVL